MSNFGLQKIIQNLNSTLERDSLVQTTTDEVRELIQVDRVLLYYFYREWSGQVTFESLSKSEFSIFGCKGPDECFNGEYAAMYQAGRVRAIADIKSEPIQPCHRDFLLGLKVQANLVVPILNQQRLWGLLVAHNCQSIRTWSTNDIEIMQKAAKTLANAPSIINS